MIKRKNARWSIAALTVMACLSGCEESGNQAATAGPPAVEVVKLQAQRLAFTSDLPGRIEPMRVAEVRARVSGIVLSRKFVEGADVKSGDVLFQIDPAPLQAALSRARADLAKIEAAVFDAKAVVHRYEPLVGIDAISRQDFDTAQTTFKSAQAARASALADVQTAQLNLDYATVKAPISGRIGRALVTEGALVGQGEATAMATIQQLDPIYADFKQPVADMLRMRAALTDGKDGNKGAPISITVDGTDQKRGGKLLFSDVTVDRGTGQVSLRGQFANPDGLLLPGMYVRVHAGQGADPQAILVPQRAVQRNVDGTAQVIVVGKGDIAESRSVRTGTMQGADWHIIQGLEAGDLVVVGGGHAARLGEKVSVTDVTSKATTPAVAVSSNSTPTNDAHN
jgi:multidrug efflux system membrane fusion protein